MSILEHGLKSRQKRKLEFGENSLDLLPERTRRALARIGDQFTVWPGHVLLTKGSSVHWVFIVLDGELVLRPAEEGAGTEGQETVVRAGSAYGALETVGYARATGDLVARDVTRVLTLPTRAYRGLAETDSNFAYWIIRALAGRSQ